MDGQRFDDLTRLLGVSLHRKRFLAFVAAAVAATPLVGETVAAKKGKRRKRRRGGGVVTQGSNGVCDTLCSGTGPDPQFCGSFGNCGSDEDCILQDPSRPICCTTGSCGGAGEGACCSAPVCGGFCDKDADCPEVEDCICDESENRCVTQTCGGSCTKTADCQDLPGCSCEFPANGLAVGGEGEPLGQCVTATCGGFCEKDADCPEVAGCVCDESENECVTITCAGLCFKDADCPDLENCSCTINISPTRVGAEGIIPGSCVSEACPGDCSSNPDCTEQGEGNCVCFFGVGVDVASASEVAAEGDNGGSCGACLAQGAACDASTECCGQLVCDAGRCQRKRKPNDRCHKHGGSCRRDNDCCAQAVCFKGKCGEKDTHCKNDSECAQGYRCQGGPLSPGHRRCRKNGRRGRNRRNARGKKR
jgi:hypothetical protein